MKKKSSSTLLAFLAMLITAYTCAQTTTLPSPNENYIQSKTCLDADCIKKEVTVEYFDGLGRAKQIVDVKASPTGRDVVTHIEYDNAGRQVKEFLPVPQSGTMNGAIVPDPLANATNPNIYGDERIFAEKKVEKSPLGRLQEQTKVGKDWEFKPIKYEYSVNSDNEIRKYITNTTTVEGIFYSIVKVADDPGSFNGFYKENMIYKNTAKDEDGNTTIEFFNDKDQLILSRKVLSPTENADTYYIYNKYSLLAFIIPPKASDAIKSLSPGAQIPDNILNDLCYQYRPDGDGRVAEKKLPNKGWEYFVYDKSDRLILTQDAVLRTVNNNFTKRGWMFNKYDTFGRLVYTGFFSNTASRLAMQTAVNSMTANAGNFETRTGSSFNLNGMDVFYTKNAFPTGSMTILSVNYYDEYPPYSFNPPFPTEIYGKKILTDNPNNPATIHHSTKGLHILTLLKNIENDNWTKNYNYYDVKGRIAGTYSINHLDGYTKKENDLDFTGIAQHTKIYHKRLPTDPEKIITEIFDYDDQNRLLVHKHQVDNNPVEILAQNDYNELSQIKNKKVGGTDPAAPIQSIDYKYNIQGWLTKINNPQNLGNKLFAYEVKFTNPVNTSLAPAYYNGNISEIDWIASGSDVLKRYSYQYDAMGRLKSGIYSEPNASIPVNNYYNEVLTYDLNGNVATLKRNRNAEYVGAQLMDDLTYSYTGNRLDSVTDGSGNYLGYPDTSGSVITYDDNANMKSQVDKNILQVDYNYLNLPSYIKFNRAVTTRFGTSYVNTNYAYRSDGVKLSKRYNYFINGRGSSLGAVSANDYLDGFQYKNDNFGASISSDGVPMLLQFVPTEEGYFDFVQNKYFYQYKDQVGNVRVAYYKDASGNPAVDRATDFYPFGLEFGGSGLSTGGSLSPNYLYSFQEQEKQEETGWSSFKWRNYDPTFVRFFNIDPLAETYAYQSPFNFSENKVTNGRELEGLEWVSVFSRVTPLLENTSVRPSPVVEVATKTGDGVTKTNDHHIIPRQFKNTDVVKEARKQGFEFEGKENKVELEQFSKSTGEGRHANHPRYNKQMGELLKEIPKSEALTGLRNLKNRAKDIINTNPDTKINDLKLKNTPPIKTDNIRVERNPPPVIMPVAKPKDPCADIPNCA